MLSNQYVDGKTAPTKRINYFFVSVLSASSDQIIDIIAAVALDGVSALVPIVYVGIYKKKE